MKTKLAFSTATLAIGLSLGLVSSTALLVPKPAIAADKGKDEKDKKAVLTPKFGKPLQEADALMKAKDFNGALAKLQEIDKMTGKNPYETYLVDELLGLTYVNLQNYSEAAKRFEATVGAGFLDAAQTAGRIKAIAQIYYQSKDYPKSIEWVNKYTAQYPDPEVQVLAGNAYYIQKDFKNAAMELRKTMKMAQAKNIAPKKEWLELVMSADYEAKDTPAVQQDLEMIVANYPEPKYWTDLLNLVEKTLKDKSQRTSLDIYRLMFATGAMSAEGEFTEMANIAMQQALPGEAKRVLAQAESKGLLSGANKALMAKASAAAAEDLKGLPATEAQARAQKTGDADVKFGEAYASHGQYDKAVEAIQRGIGKGVKDKDDAQFRLGLAYLGAGKTAEAKAAFGAISPGTNAATFSRLWNIQSGNKA